MQFARWLRLKEHFEHIIWYLYICAKGDEADNGLMLSNHRRHQPHQTNKTIVVAVLAFESLDGTGFRPK